MISWGRMASSTYKLSPGTVNKRGLALAVRGFGSAFARTVAVQLLI